MTEGAEEDQGPLGRSGQASLQFLYLHRLHDQDGGIVLGQNTWFGFPMATANVVIDIQPKHGHRILMQTYAGWIHSGTDFFIADAGLVGSETTLGVLSGFEEKGVPEFARFRRATQDANSIDEWCAIMREGNNGGYANAWLLGDIRTGEIARLELGLQNVGFERKRDDYFSGSNIAESLEILRLESDDNDRDIRSDSVARRVRWKRLMKALAGEIDLRAHARHAGQSLRRLAGENSGREPFALRPWGCGTRAGTGG